MSIDRIAPLKYGVIHFEVDSGCSIQNFLNLKLPDLAADELLKLINLGSIYVNDQRCFDFEKKLLCNDRVRIHTKPRRYNCDTLSLNQVVYQDNDWLVFNKPSGIPSHPMVDNYKENLLFWLKNKLNSDLFITTRLDTVTNGLLTFAKNKISQNHYNKLLMYKKIKKEYRALLSGSLSDFKKINESFCGLWLHYMTPTKFAPKAVHRDAELGWLDCKLKLLNAIDKSDSTFEVHIELLTGRTHQIRAQMAFEGFPVVGDVLYGAKPVEHNKIKLSCVRLAWDQFDFKI